MSESLEQVFRELFAALDSAGYSWQPSSPDRIQRMRKDAARFAPLERFFGLGLPVEPAELRESGLSPRAIAAAQTLRPAISRRGDLFFAHSHWDEPPTSGSGPVYLGEETYALLDWLEPRLPLRKRLLDIGSGCGAISIALARKAELTSGIELSNRAVAWAEAAAGAQDVRNAAFRQAEVDAPSADPSATAFGSPWDLAVFNPPMAVPTPGRARIQRDGGALGIEIPLAFLAFAERHLRADGEAFCLATSPIVHGRSVFFERLASLPWRVLDAKRLNDRFNQSLARKDGYSGLGIERIELWLLHLRKRSL